MTVGGPMKIFATLLGRRGGAERAAVAAAERIETDCVPRVLNLSVLCLAALCVVPMAAKASADHRRKVLILYSFDDLLPWQAGVRTGLQERLAESSAEDRPDVYEERLDDARIDGSVSAPAITTYLKAKYASVSFDAIVAESAAATHFLLLRPDLFASAQRYAVDPVGVESVAKNDSGIRVISPQGDWAGTALSTITRLLPGIDRIIAIVDHSAVGEANTRSLLGARAALPQGVGLEIWGNLSFDELFERAAHVPPGTAFFYLPIFQDRLGAHRTPRSVVRSLVAVSPAPIFAQHDTFLGTGIVGGGLLSSQQEGRMIADLALGPPYSERWADPTARLNPYMFDDAALKRWRIANDRLPPGSIVSGRTEVVWYRYRWEIGTAVAALLLEGLLILCLITALRERKAAMAALMRERDGLEMRVSERTAELLAATRHLEDSNARLEDLASTDGLTGLANRRRFLEVAMAGIRYAHHHHQPLSFLMLDIDRFKSINDRHGHAVGDEVIRAMGQACKAKTSATDCVGRMGGEEFAILMTGADGEAALAGAERIRSFTKSLRIETASGASVTLTVSIGVSTLLGAHDTLDDMAARADAALYQAKREGRDRVVGHFDSRQPTALIPDPAGLYCA